MKDFDLYFRAWVIKDKYMSKVQDIDFVGAYVVIEDKDGNQVMKEKSEIILMQGLEINDLVVYDGDIIEVYNEDIEEMEKFVMYFNEEYGKFYFESVLTGGRYDLEEFDEEYGLDIEVLGNIYENKGLVANE